MTDERDAEKRPRRSTETWGDEVANAHEVDALARNHEHRRPFKGLRPHPVLCQRNSEVLDGSSRLPLKSPRATTRERTGPAVNTILGDAALSSYGVPGTRSSQP